MTLVAVTKYAELDWVRELVSLGQMDLGESRPQQLVSRAGQLPDTVRWHMIGHLQRNKTESLAPVATLIHSVDSTRLFDYIAKLGTQYQTRPAILLEVNVSGEQTKDGFRPDELLAVWPRFAECDSVRVEGLMTMAPLDDSPDAARPVFRQLREFRDELRSRTGGRITLNELSMGMSGDFEVAIEEGATLVRIGSRLFEGLSSDQR